jgi:DNA-binding XRE family transcriptional regulator
MAYETITRGGKRYVLVPTEEFAAMRTANTAAALPAMPKPDAAGNVPAAEFARATIVRGLIRDREAAGLSQSALARMSGVRVETLNRIERGHVTPDVATLLKLDAAIKRKRRGTARPGGANGKAKRAGKSARGTKRTSAT